MVRQFERCRAGPRTFHVDVNHVVARQLADARGFAVHVRNDLQQEVRALQAAFLFGQIQLAVLVTHGAGCHAHGAVVERADQRVLVGQEPGRGEFLWEAPHFTAAGQRRMVVQVHRERVRAGLAFVGDRDDLAAFGVIAKAGGVGHADELVGDQRFGHLERFRHHGAQLGRVGAVRDDEEFAVDEAVWAGRVGGARKRHREGGFADGLDVHGTPCAGRAASGVGNRYGARER